MSKAPADPRDNYGPKKNTNTALALSPSCSSEKTLALSSPSYLNKIMVSPQPITSSRTRPPAGIRPALVTPLHFTSQISSPSSLNVRPTKLAYYSPPETTPKSTFITKNQIVPIVPLENHYCPQNTSLLQIVSKILPPGFFYLPEDSNLRKTRKYYEFILVDTDSIVLTHHYDSKDPSKITFSKFKINKVLTPADWGQPPYKEKALSRTFVPQCYNYYDYMKAWYHFLDIEPYNHTWFIWFNKNISINFPSWFIEWFYTIGPILDTLPDYAFEAFKLFKDTTTCPQHKALLGFCAVFGITWITSWTLSTEPLWEDAPPLQLVKRYSVKWWSKFNPQLLSSERLNAWFKANPNLCKATKLSSSSDTTDFSSIHPKLLETLKGITDPQEFMDKVKDAMSVLSDTESTSITSAAENEDDCYGIQDL
ncbi:hypothetical protein QL285_091232 [Trifolium repens]|nr:hypothetical protein QL285_091232 [Trifolium repens]